MCVVLECLCCIRKDLTTVQFYHKTDTVLSPNFFFFFFVFALATSWSYQLAVLLLIVDTAPFPLIHLLPCVPPVLQLLTGVIILLVSVTGTIPPCDGGHYMVCSHSGGQETS